MAQKKIDIVTWLKNWFEVTTNKVTSWAATTNDLSDSKYPSEKLVKTSLDGKVDTSSVESTWVNNSTNPVQSKTIKTALDGKAPSDHTHGLIQNNGSLRASNQPLPNKIMISDTNGNIVVHEKNHAVTDGTIWGKGTGTKYGHNIIVDNLNSSTAVDGEALSAHQGYVLDQNKASSTHTHGNINNDGTMTYAIGTFDHHDYPVVISGGQDDEGTIKTGLIDAGYIISQHALSNIGTSADEDQETINRSIDTALGNKANSNHNQASSTITDSNTYANIENAAQTQASINSAINTKLGTINTAIASAGAVTLTKETTANTGYLATYTFTQNGISIGQIDIPKDFLVKSGSVKTVTTADSPVSGYVIGDKYIDLVVNTKDSSGTDEHLYIKTTDLVEDTTYGADESTLTAYTSNGENKFKVKDGGITVTQLNSTLQAHLVDINSIRLGPTTGTDAGCIIFDSITNPYTTYS